MCVSQSVGRETARLGREPTGLANKSNIFNYVYKYFEYKIQENKRRKRREPGGVHAARLRNNLLSCSVRNRKRCVLRGQNLLRITHGMRFAALRRLGLQKTAAGLRIALLPAPNVAYLFALYDKIWGEDMYGDIKTVAVHSNRLREKVEKESAKPAHIQTVWGAGYRFMR